MFGSSYAEFVQGSALKTWDCVAQFASLLWYKFIHLRDPIMPRSRRRHHSRSRSRSRSHDRDREPKRRKIESYDSPHHRRSVSSEPEAIVSAIDDRGIDKQDVQVENKLSSLKNNTIEKSCESVSSNSTRISKESDDSLPLKEISDSEMNESNNQLDLTESETSTSSKNKDKNTELVENTKDNEEDTKEGKNKSSENEEQGTKSDTENENDRDTELIENTEDNEEDVETGENNKSSENEEQDSKSDKESDEDPNKSLVEDAQIVDVSSDETERNYTPGKLNDKTKDLNITPKKALTPKQVQKKLESEKKRLEKQKEKDERERKKLEEKKKINDEKLRIKQEKEELRNKEKIAKEERKKKEQEERDKKRREKEEKDEQKKKEREQEKLKKLQEIEEKNKEKQKLEEQKQKTAAAFVNFFVSKKSDSTEERKTEESSNFMPFEIKSDMRLAPVTRRNLESEERVEFEEKIEKPNKDIKLYLDELKDGKEVSKFGKTWPFEELDQDDDDDVVIVEENVGETIVEQKPKLEKMRAKFFKFAENQRPPYFGTFKKKSKTVGARKPFGRDSIFNYEIDSDEEWEEEGEGESLKGTDDEDEKENESDNDYEVDNDVFVPHGHLSGDERDDEENAKFSPESHKAKLKLLKNEFDEEMKSKLQKIKPRVIGCIWYDKTKSNVEEAIDRYLQPFAIICNGQIQIKKRSEFAPASLKKVSKQLSKEYVPIFLKLIHGSIDKKKNIVKSFMENMSNNGIQVDVSEFGLCRQLKNFAQWQKCPEEGAMHNKMCWYVGEDIRKEYNVNLVLPNKLNRKRNKTK